MRPADHLDAADPLRCQCGAVEAQVGDFAECRECEKPICDTCNVDQDWPICAGCDEVRNEAAYERSYQREMGEGGIQVGEAYRQEQARRLK